MSHHFLKWLAILSSDTEVAVVARVVTCFTGRRPLKAHPIFKFAASMQLYRFTSSITKADG